MKRILSLLLLLPIFLFSQKPEDFTHNNKYYVDDYAHIFSQSQIVTLDSIIRSTFNSYEIALLTVPTMADMSIEDFALGIGRGWKVGGKSNNGIVMVLSPSTHQLRTETGFGMEGILPDITASNLADEYAIPEFKKGDYYTGLYNYLTNLNVYLSPAKQELRKAEELKQAAIAEKEYEKNVENLLNFLIFLFFLIIFGVLIYIYYRHKKAQKEAIEEEKAECQKLINKYFMWFNLCKIYSNKNVISSEIIQNKESFLNQILKDFRETKSWQGFRNIYNELTKFDTTGEFWTAFVKANIFNRADNGQNWKILSIIKKTLNQIEIQMEGLQFYFFYKEEIESRIRDTKAKMKEEEERLTEIRSIYDSKIEKINFRDFEDKINYSEQQVKKLLDFVNKIKADVNEEFEKRAEFFKAGPKMTEKMSELVNAKILDGVYDVTKDRIDKHIKVLNDNILVVKNSKPKEGLELFTVLMKEADNLIYTAKDQYNDHKRKIASALAAARAAEESARNTYSSSSSSSNNSDFGGGGGFGGGGSTNSW